MRILFLLAIVFALIGWGVATSPPPSDLIHGDPAPAVASGVTNGERWRRICAVEAGPSKRDQEDCVTMHALAFVFAKRSAEFEERRRDAAR